MHNGSKVTFWWMFSCGSHLFLLSSSPLVFWFPPTVWKYSHLTEGSRLWECYWMLCVLYDGLATWPVCIFLLLFQWLLGNAPAPQVVTRRWLAGWLAGGNKQLQWCTSECRDFGLFLCAQHLHFLNVKWFPSEMITSSFVSGLSRIPTIVF